MEVTNAKGQTPDSRYSLLAYLESASWLRVFLVCSTVFVPSFTITILIELLPLRPPGDGWQANWVFWIRFFVSSATVTFGTAIQTASMVPSFGLSFRHIMGIAFGTVSCYTLYLLLLANYWRFPVPFAVLVGNPAWQISRYACLALAVGAEKYRENPLIKQQADASRPFTIIQTGLILIYPVYNALFLRLHGMAQVAFILVLAAIKYGMSRLLARHSKRVPITKTLGLVTIELFGALYLFKCMQSAGSMLSGGGLIFVDLIHNLKRIRKLRKRVKQITQQLVINDHGKSYHDRIRESMHRVESRSRSMLNAPSIFVPTNAVAPDSTIVTSIAKRKWTELDANVQALLLECEHIMLVEFIECAVPLFYSLYLVILFHLPNARYYPETKSLDWARLSRTVRNIALYAVLELVSLVYMHTLLHWKFGISAFHLLGSALERDKIILQAVFTQWVVLVLQFTVQHQGTVLLLWPYV